MNFKDKRKKMENLIYETFMALDPSGTNTEKYQKMFKVMSDKEFDDFFKKYFKDEDSYMVWDIVDFERRAKIENIEKAAKVLGIPLEEYVVMPFVNDDINNPTVTKNPVPVGYLHLKRMQQIQSKKNSMSIDISERNPITNQVRGDDKNAKQSDQESYALVALGSEHILREFMGPRADDPVMKNQMYGEISRKGYVSMNELTDNVENKTTLRMVDWYYTGMMIKTDLVTKGYETIHTLNKDK